ncbi:DNA polymerase ligase N-terminal domain-containing protein [Aeoliella sp. SH292]|uniref:DNA polymerase ligase N-terminal domain-containing protein n=1 Tax=Aeoliella sp. SH292 TaxID=3454464 RepID=UPI003F98E13E
MPLRLVLLRHDVPGDFGRPRHWDLLLERADDCWTWAIEILPAAFGGDSNSTSVSAIRLANHRKHYLDYEGPVSDGRGQVARVLTGTYELASQSEAHLDIEALIERERMRILLEQGNQQSWNLSIP